MTEIRFFNGTPHDINIIAGGENCGTHFDKSLRKYVVDGEGEETIVLSIPSNGMLNAKFEVVDNGYVNQVVPIRGKHLVSLDPLPEGYDIYIVSALYYSACQSMKWDCSQLYTVIDPVYTTDGRTVLGCLALGKI